jgi:hypothetical protein
MNLASQPVLNRLAGIHKAMLSSYEAGNEMSSSTKGSERELFVHAFLSQALPTHYRLASGDIINAYGKRSGQIDIVVESTSHYSFPVHANGPRLYLAEGVAAAIEVKSNIQKQWDEVERSVTALQQLRKRLRQEYLTDEIGKLEAVMLDARSPHSRALKEDARAALQRHRDQLVKERELLPYQNPEVPHYAIGFKGCQEIDALTSKLARVRIDGIVSLDPLQGVFMKKLTVGGRKGAIGINQFMGPEVLWHFLDALHHDVVTANNQVSPWLNYRNAPKSEKTD